jgi:Ca2+-binding RTX toxin-like protein
MRKTIQLLVFMSLGLLLATGVALAATKDCTALANSCRGTNNPDTLIGSPVRDVIYGFDAADQLFGNLGDDTLLGGRDGDTLKGGEGADHLVGGPGVDKLFGGDGRDTLSDYRSASRADPPENNVMSGGSGDDHLYGTNTLDGGPGNDRVEGSHAGRFDHRTLTGGAGLDRISSNGFVFDTIFAQDGEKDTILTCGRKRDTVYYDAGIDIVNPESCEQRITDPAPE